MQMNAFQQDRDLSDKIDPVFSSGEWIPPGIKTCKSFHDK